MQRITEEQLNALIEENLNTRKNDWTQIPNVSIREGIEKLLLEGIIWQISWANKSGYAFKFNHKNLMRIVTFCEHQCVPAIPKDEKRSEKTGRIVYTGVFDSFTIRFVSSGGTGNGNKGKKFEEEVCSSINKCINMNLDAVTDKLVKGIMICGNIGRFVEPARLIGDENKRRYLRLDGEAVFDGSFDVPEKDIISKGVDLDSGNPIDIHIDVKFGKTVSFCSRGLKDYITKEDFENSQISSQAGQKLLTILGLYDNSNLMKHFFGVFNSYKELKETQAEKQSYVFSLNFDKERIANIVGECLDEGYIVVHKIDKNLTDIYGMWGDTLKNYMNVQSALVKFTYGNKRVEILLNCANNKKLRMTFRNKDYNGVYPTFFLLDWVPDDYTF